MSECACIYADYAYPDFVSEKKRTARKQHKCGECQRVIQPGEVYLYTFGRWDNDTATHKVCEDCSSIIDSFFCVGYQYGAILDDLWEHIDGLDGNVPSDCILPLTPAARERVFEMIEEVWDKE